MNCDNIIQESGAMGNAIYNSNWADTPYDVFNRFRKDMITVMLRSKRPSNITAAKFFPISLQSFTNVSVIQSLQINVNTMISFMMDAIDLK